MPETELPAFPGALFVLASPISADGFSVFFAAQARNLHSSLSLTCPAQPVGESCWRSTVEYVWGLIPAQHVFCYVLILVTTRSWSTTASRTRPSMYSLLSTEAGVILLKHASGRVPPPLAVSRWPPPPPRSTRSRGRP